MTALSFGRLEEAYILVYENAKELIEESYLLFNNKRFARSYALAQIAHEELAKLPIIYQESSRSFFKEKHDWKSFYKRLRNHKAKNKQNFVFYQMMLREIEEANLNFTTEKMQGHLEYVNHMKNISLYADVKNNRYTKPSFEIKESLAKAQLELVEEMFKTYSLTNFHIKGEIKKSLDNDKAKLRRELFKKSGLIK